MEREVNLYKSMGKEFDLKLTPDAGREGNGESDPNAMNYALKGNVQCGL